MAEALPTGIVGKGREQGAEALPTGIVGKGREQGAEALPTGIVGKGREQGAEALQNNPFMDSHYLIPAFFNRSLAYFIGIA